MQARSQTGSAKCHAFTLAERADFLVSGSGRSLALPCEKHILPVEKILIHYLGERRFLCINE